MWFRWTGGTVDGEDTQTLLTWVPKDTLVSSTPPVNKGHMKFSVDSESRLSFGYEFRHTDVNDNSNVVTCSAHSPKSPTLADGDWHHVSLVIESDRSHRGASAKFVTFHIDDGKDEQELSCTPLLQH